ncbi:hypothetical protein [Micromonospora humidisoli]|uniref:Phage protein, HK97 gp10 family n=1 Tax=Micromonospora humidisoli TaxID=2807622 RepID=A0ABS2JAM1_9ACTN|nr:hypothetical protein [Micromonospora humidisoli]MBM7083602.1 hypothetical protein [Micromonospora humidisoli]
MIELSTDQEALQALARALGEQADGKRLRRELAKGLRQALEPAKQEVRAGLMGMSTAGIPVEGPPLRTVVLSKLKAEARLTGRSTGARLRIRKKGMPRGFANAPKRLNSRKGWRHRVYGRDVWVQQIGEPEFFDRPTRQHKAAHRAAVLKVMNEHARYITRKV